MRISAHVKKPVDQLWRLNIVHTGLLLQRPLRFMRCFIFRASHAFTLPSTDCGIAFCRLAKKADFMSMLQEIFLCAADAGSLASRNIMAWNKAIAFRARAAELLEVRKILHHDPLFLPGDGSAAGFSH